MDPVTPIYVDRNILQVWALAAVFAAAAYWGAARRAVAAIAVLLFALVTAVMLWMELQDPATAGGLTAAFGSAYLLHARVAAVATIVAPSAAAVIARARRHVV